MKTERKTILMFIAAALVVLISVPSVIFNEAFKKYFSFLYSWKVAAVPSTSATMPQPPRDYDVQAPQPELRFVEFRIRAPMAKSVRLSGDFNKWDPGKLELKKSGKYWKTILTLPVGEYRYLYVVDGEFLTDPLNPETTYYKNRKVSLAKVK